MRVGKRMRNTVIAGAFALAAGGGGAVLISNASADSAKDCRTYSSATVCGEVKLNSTQSECVARSVELGMTERRAEVECTRAP